MDRLTPIVKWLLILNVGIYLGDLYIFEGKLVRFGAFWLPSAVYGGHFYEFITFQFFHANLFHLFMNCMGLYFFGPWIERYLGSKLFSVFYLVCGVGGGLAFWLLTLTGILPSGDALRPLVGASAGIYGILIAVALIAPNARVMLVFPPVELSMRTVAIGVVAIAVGAIVFRIGGNEGGEAGHLGGAFVGFLLMKLHGLQQAGFIGKRKRKRTDIPPKIRPRTMVDLHSQTEIDAILDKISRDGFQSITDEERELLTKEANKRNL